MKAEHRKELETNLLADRMGRLVDSIKSRPKNTYLVWGAIILVIAVGIGWYFTSGWSWGKSSSLWLQLDAATNFEELQKKATKEKDELEKREKEAGRVPSPAQLDAISADNLGLKELEAIAEKNRGTLPARTARFEQARILLAQGIQNLGSPEQHASALDKLEKARDLYKELAPEAKDVPLLAQEAMMGSARAEESLVGSGKNGSLDEAQKLYQTLADAYPKTALGEAAAKRANDLKDPAKRKEIEDVYKQLNQSVARGR